jgi:hypothetical protein
VPKNTALSATAGDVVEIRNTGGPPLQLEQNGDWTIPWQRWRDAAR